MSHALKKQTNKNKQETKQDFQDKVFIMGLHVSDIISILCLIKKKKFVYWFIALLMKKKQLSKIFVPTSFVRFNTEEQAQKAARDANGRVVNGLPITVRRSQPRNK